MLLSWWKKYDPTILLTMITNHMHFEHAISLRNGMFDNIRIINFDYVFHDLERLIKRPVKFTSGSVTIASLYIESTINNTFGVSHALT